VGGDRLLTHCIGTVIFSWLRRALYNFLGGLKRGGGHILASNRGHTRELLRMKEGFLYCIFMNDTRKSPRRGLGGFDSFGPRPYMYLPRVLR
jgi:hypothetical protein